MNDIAKQNIKEKLEIALHKEVITTNREGELLGINPAYISMIKNPKSWAQCPAHAWESVLAWVNSGQGFIEYSQKHGKCVAEKKTIPVEVNHEEGLSNETLAEISTDPRVKKENPTPKLKKQSPNFYEYMNKKQETSRGNLIDLLLEEKESLRIKLDAIDTLLKFYIS